jgi:predicted metalloprotease
MRYNPKAKLDRSQVQVRRGGSSGGGSGMRVGGGIGGLIVLVLVFVLQSQFGGGSEPPVDSGEQTSSLDNCQTGDDANQDASCALLADVNSIQAFWAEALPEQGGGDYAKAVTTIFSGGTDTGCGAASSDVGPFYCPVDQHVYLDPTFFDQMLEGQLGAEGGLFSEAYVLAHEYGHHVQNLTGQLGKVRTQQGPTSDAVRLELQADCYAGMWSKFATEVPDDSGEPFILDLTDEDIANALDAARAVGDDRIQERSGGRVDPDRWTHGSADQRMSWFQVGLAEGSMQACDTFAATQL